MNERDYEGRQRAEEAYHRKLQGEHHDLVRRGYEMRERQMKLEKQMSSGSSGGGCFVATATFGHYDAPEVVFLRTFRDELLSQSVLGRGFIQTYYIVSPPLAAVIANSESLRGIVRKFFLQPAIFLLRYFKHQ